MIQETAMIRAKEKYDQRNIDLLQLRSGGPALNPKDLERVNIFFTR
jgi:hypothetical protein